MIMSKYCPDGFTPRVAVVLGSGLGDFVSSVRIIGTLDYADVDGMPVSTVSGHAGRFVFGYVEDTPVVLMQGRVHLYEGYSPHEVVFPIRLMRQMGAEVLLLTNAAGGIDPTLKPGSFMALTDHIAQFVPSPLVGPNDEALGTRFPDMSAVYSPELRAEMHRVADGLGIPLSDGVYIQFSGPAYETPAEIRMARVLGASAVGMSTAIEAMAARHCGYTRIGAISCISNYAAGVTDKPLSHDDIKQMAAMVSTSFAALLGNIVKSL